MSMQIEIDTKRLIACRKKLGLTQAEAAELVGVSQPAYQRYEAGTRSPSVQVAMMIANAMHISMDYLTGSSKTKQPDFILVNKQEDPTLFTIVEQCKGFDDEQLKRLLVYFKHMQESGN